MKLLDQGEILETVRVLAYSSIPIDVGEITDGKLGEAFEITVNKHCERLVKSFESARKNLGPVPGRPHKITCIENAVILTESSHKDGNSPNRTGFPVIIEERPEGWNIDDSF